MRHLLPPLLVGILLLAAWQALHEAGGSTVITAPAETFIFLARLMGTARFMRDVGETGLAFAWALLLSIGLGVTLGIVLGLNRISGEVIEPLLVTFYALPKVTLYPLVLLAFGLGMSARVAFGVMHGLVPITLMTRNAITQLKPVYWRSAKVMHLSRFSALHHVVLPAILPDLVAAVRIGFSLSLLGVLIGEMFASKRGLGFAAVNAMGLGDIRTIMAIGAFLAVFAVAANTGLLALETAIRHRVANRF
jgi:NitT/TauT family transport system permease protein